MLAVYQVSEVLRCKKHRCNSSFHGGVYSFVLLAVLTVASCATLVFGTGETGGNLKLCYNQARSSVSFLSYGVAVTLQWRGAAPLPSVAA